MQTIEIAEAQTRFLDLIAAVRAGDEVMLSENQKPVAQLVPVVSASGVMDRPEDVKAPRPRFGSAAGLIIEREDCWENETEMWKEYMP